MHKFPQMLGSKGSLSESALLISHLSLGPPSSSDCQVPLYRGPQMPFAFFVVSLYGRWEARGVELCSCWPRRHYCFCSRLQPAEHCIKRGWYQPGAWVSATLLKAMLSLDSCPILIPTYVILKGSLPLGHTFKASDLIVYQ